MSWLYLAALAGSALCLGLVDRRWRLVAFARPGRTAVLLATGLAFFLAWDLLAIGLDIYARGDSPAMTGVELAPELPLEEPVFIVFLCYLTVVLHALLRQVVAGRAEHRAPAPDREVAR